MKKLLIFFALFTTLDEASAQSAFNRAYHSASETPNPFLVSINSNVYFTTQSHDVGAFDVCYVYKHTSTGILKFKSPLYNGIAFHGFKSFDDKLIITGRNSFCDVINGQVSYLTKLDTNGIAIFTSTYSASVGDEPTACLQYADSSYFSFTDSLLFKHSKSGQFISKTNLNLTGISSALLLQNTNILLSAKQSNTIMLLELSASGVVVSSHNNSVLFKKLSYYDGQKILALGDDGNLYKISSTLELISGTSNSGSFISDFVNETDTIYALSTTPGFCNYLVMDTYPI